MIMKTLEEIFNDVTLIGQTPNLIISTQLPDRIYQDILSWVEPCREIKDDEFAQLLNHVNVGTNHNTYQTSIPRKFIDNSFFLGYLINFGNVYLQAANIPASEQRPVHLRNYSGHYDGYDIWMNFTYKGDDNPLHNHAGSLSGILYVKDSDGQPTHFPYINYTHQGKEGELIIFPSHLQHFVEIKQTDSERITVSFNLDVYNQ
jgi:hypothetical protein